MTSRMENIKSEKDRYIYNQQKEEWVDFLCLHFCKLTFVLSLSGEIDDDVKTTKSQELGYLVVSARAVLTNYPQKYHANVCFVCGWAWETRTVMYLCIETDIESCTKHPFF